MSRNFTLTLTINGTSLDEIDQELMQAAGERLVARMSKPPVGGNIGAMVTATPPPAVTPAPMKSEPVAPTVAREPAPAAAEPEKAKRGRKPGTKFGHYKKGEKQNETENDSPESADDSPAPEDDGGGDQELQSPAPASDPGAPESKKSSAPAREVSLGETVEALKLVNLKHNADKARECLTEFGVKRCGELSQEQRVAFLAHCEKLCS